MHTHTKIRTARAAMLAAVGAFALLATQTSAAQNTDIHILCSNGFRAPMEKLRPEIEHRIGRKIDIQYGSSAKLHDAIESGEPFDVTIVTAPVVKSLMAAGKIASGTYVDLGSSRIGVAVRAGVRKPKVETSEAIKRTLLDAKSIGFVKEGASTPPILDMLRRLDISQTVQPKMIPQPGAEQSMKNLAAGQVDLAFGLVSEILPAPGVRLAGALPAEFQKRITLSAGIASATKNREASEQFIRSLTSAHAAMTMKAFGLDPVAKEK